MKKITSISEQVNKNSVRRILPQMVKVSNNSRLTSQVANNLATTLSEVEFNDFIQWLKLVESNQHSTSNRWQKW
jgi:hypothetical protein